nr:aminotransferase class V-fold PLP-dependent enzyme [Micromonospora sp. DSM 115978]
SSVLNCAQHHAGQHAATGSGEFVSVGVDRYGRVDPDDTRYLAPPPGTVLASLQHANHEVGTIQPVAAVAERLHAAGVPLHCDAAMTIGRLPVVVPALGADLVTASAHKFGGPAGVGILVVRSGTRWVNPLPGDSREFGRAAGFPNLPAVVAAAVALHARAGEIVTESPRLAGYVDEVRRRLPELVGDVDLLGPPDTAAR